MECLLRLTQQYKAQKAIENVDWESCVTKYGDLLQLFSAEYPAASASNEKGFPHTVEELTKTALTTKLKAIRAKCRHAVDSGRKSGHGRVVLPCTISGDNSTWLWPGDKWHGGSRHGGKLNHWLSFQLLLPNYDDELLSEFNHTETRTYPVTEIT